MAVRTARRVAGSVGVGLAAVLLLGGCQIVSRVVMADPSPGLGPLATCVLLAVAPPDDGRDAEDVLAATAEAIQARLIALQLDHLETSTIAPDRLLVGLPAGETDRWRSVVERTGDLQFVPLPADMDDQTVVDGQPLPATVEIAPLFDGSAIDTASRSEDQLGQPSVGIVLDQDAAAAFDAFAADHFGERFAIVLDGIVLSAPSINATRFDGNLQISGDFDQAMVDDLLAVVASGRLPTSVTEVAVTEPVDGQCTLATTP